MYIEQYLFNLWLFEGFLVNNMGLCHLQICCLKRQNLYAVVGKLTAEDRLQRIVNLCLKVVVSNVIVI
jgi:hypothetical protein